MRLNFFFFLNHVETHLTLDRMTEAEANRILAKKKNEAICVLCVKDILDVFNTNTQMNSDFTYF